MLNADHKLLLSIIVEKHRIAVNSVLHRLSTDLSWVDSMAWRSWRNGFGAYPAPSSVRMLQCCARSRCWGGPCSLPDIILVVPIVVASGCYSISAY
jgi:hypothetical protein